MPKNCNSKVSMLHSSIVSYVRMTSSSLLCIEQHLGRSRQKNFLSCTSVSPPYVGSEGGGLHIHPHSCGQEHTGLSNPCSRLLARTKTDDGVSFIADHYVRRIILTERREAHIFIARPSYLIIIMIIISFNASFATFLSTKALTK